MSPGLPLKPAGITVQQSGHGSLLLSGMEPVGIPVSLTGALSL